MTIAPSLARSTLALLAALTAPACALLGSAPRAPLAQDCVTVAVGADPVGSVPIRVETVVTGLQVPWGLAFLPGGDLLVTERPGRVRLVRARTWQLEPRPVLVLPVAELAEGGLLGLAAHPDFAHTRWFYVYRTVDASGGTANRVERFRLADDGASAEPAGVILDGIPAATYHNGGRLRFGPDGMLYVATGDARTPDLAQDLNSPSGKILRLRPDGTIPTDNPYPGRAVFVSGVRNSAGFDWRGPTDLLVTDHGPSIELGRFGHDEVNVARPGTNLGWPWQWGCEARDGYTSPALTWTAASPPGGAAIYHGDAIPEWRGSLLIGVLRGRHLHRVAFDPEHPSRVRLHEVYLRGDAPSGYGRLREVLEGPDGALYVTTSNCDGRGTCPPDGDRILRITR